MALQINLHNGIIELKGNLIGKNAIALQEHFEYVFSKYDNVILSMVNIKTIDNEGIRVLKSFQERAQKLNAFFGCIGKKHKKIIENLGKGTYIRKRDLK